MCGRYTLTASNRPEFSGFKTTLVDRFNIAPQSDVLVMNETLNLTLMRWDLSPPWAKSPMHLFNARAETLAEKPSFRGTKRCVFIADGWYEWQKIGSKKQPWYHHSSGQALSLAGLYQPDQGCVIVTREASAPLTQIHHRQPLLLNDDQEQAWLEDRFVDVALPQPKIYCHPVSRRVGDTRQDDPLLTVPVSLYAEKTGQTGDLFS